MNIWVGVYKWKLEDVESLGNGCTAQSVVQKSDINALGKSPNVPVKKKLEFEYAWFYAPLKVSEKNDSGTKRGLNRAYAPFSLEMKKIS